MKKYKHLLLLLYFPLYLVWFSYLEANITNHFHIIHMAIDDYIPFCEYFIVPYILWFAYVATVVLYISFKDKDSFGKMCAFLYTGMTVFLIVSTVFPNGHLLRPTSFERQNIFTELCSLLYQTDTPTNLFPSIHVYNSIGVHLTILNSKKLNKNKWICNGSLVLMVSIILSTVFLKQHSLFDVITALLLASAMHQFVYVRSWANDTIEKKEKCKSKKSLPQL